MLNIQEKRGVLVAGETRDEASSPTVEIGSDDVAQGGSFRDWQKRKKERIRHMYRERKAAGKWALLAFIAFYLVRDTLLYIILPYFLAKRGISLWDWLFG